MTPSPPLDLLVVGDINPDVIVSAPGVQPEFGQVEQLVDSADLVLGGSAAITAIGAARLGLSVGLCGVLGSDDLGQLMTVRLTEAGVDLTHVRLETSTPTGLSVILDRGDDRAVLTAPGTIAALTDDDLYSLPDRPARHVHVASYYLMAMEYRAALPSTFDRWRESGVTTSLDTNWDPAGRWELDDLLASTTLFLPNEAELTAIARSPIVERAIDVVAARGCDVVVKRGERGGASRVGDLGFRVVRTPPVEVVDAVGAGDSFNAGYLAGLLHGRSPGDALRMAVAAGTLSTSGRGGTGAQATLEDLDTWVRTLPVDEERL